MYRADKILLCTGWCYVQREVGVVTVVVVPVGRVAAGRKMGRLRRRLEVAVERRRWRRREGRHAAGGRRPRQLLLEGHRLRLDREGRDVAPDREVRAVLRARLRLRVAHRRQALRARRDGVGAARVAVRVPDARPARLGDAILVGARACRV